MKRQKQPKITAFPNAKKLSKKIAKLSSANQRLAVEYIDELEFQGEMFINSLVTQEGIRECQNLCACSQNQGICKGVSP
jgi:hypothetical protein